jgi:uncharacterized protein (TIGR03083 family)
VGGPFLLHPGDRRRRDLGHGEAASGEPDEPCPPVSGIRDALDVAVPLELVHQEAGGLLGDPGLLGELGEPAALRCEPSGQARLCRRDVVEPGRRQRLEHPRLHRPVRHEQEQADVPPVRRGSRVRHGVLLDVGQSIELNLIRGTYHFEDVVAVDRTDAWRTVEEQRLALSDLLADLTPDQWVLPSLCDGWRVRDVAAHLTLGSRVGPLTGTVEFVRARGNVNRLIHDTAVRRADAVDQARVVADLRASAASRRHPPGTSYLDPFADVLVHGQDIARPLGLPWSMPLGAAVVAATRDWTMGFPFHARRRLRGLRLTATDVDWTVGDGPVVEGPIAALLLVLTGRTASLGELSGDGLPTLRTRFSARPVGR